MNSVFVLSWHEVSGRGKDCNGGVVSVHVTLKGAKTKLMLVSNWRDEKGSNKLSYWGYTFRDEHDPMPEDDIGWIEFNITEKSIENE